MEPHLPARHPPRGPLSRRRAALITLAALTVALVSTSAQSTPASSSNQSESQPMKNFVLIFRQRPRQFTEAELAQRQKEVSAWAREQNAAGHKLDPRILAPDVIRFGETLSDGTHAGAWPITAILFLEADDLATAGKIAEAHPANHYGTHVEVRPWAPPAVPAPASR